MNKDYATSTQARAWMFSEAALASKRAAAHASALEKLAGAAAAGGSAADVKPLSLEDEALLRAFYETKLQEICRAENAADPARFTDRVLSAAQMYFKRFYLVTSAMEESPVGVMLASLFLAGKVEEEKIGVDDLVPKYAKTLSADGLVALEMKLLVALRFQVVTRSPFRCLAGLMEDMHHQAVLASGSGGGNPSAETMAALKALHAAATDAVCRALTSEAPFLFTPQQMALAAVKSAVPTLGDGGAELLDVGGWMASRFELERACEPAGAHGVKAEDTAPPLALGETIARAEAMLSAATDTSSAAARAELKRIDGQLRKVAKSVKAVEAARAAQAQAEHNERSQQRKAERAEACKAEQERMEAALAEASAEAKAAVAKRPAEEAGAFVLNRVKKRRPEA